MGKYRSSIGIAPSKSRKSPTSIESENSALSEISFQLATVFPPMKAKYNPALADDMIDFRLCNYKPLLSTRQQLHHARARKRPEMLLGFL